MCVSAHAPVAEEAPAVAASAVAAAPAAELADAAEAAVTEDCEDREKGSGAWAPSLEAGLALRGERRWVKVAEEKRGEEEVEVAVGAKTAR